MRYYIILLFLVLAINANGQGWPFEDNDRGKMTGTPGEIRDQGGGAGIGDPNNLGFVRLHGGVDMIRASDVVQDERFEVYTVGAGEVTLITAHALNGTNCWQAIITVGDYTYKHVGIDDNINLGDILEANTLLGEMFNTGGCDLHVHMQVNGNDNYLNDLAPYTDNVLPRYWNFDTGTFITNQTISSSDVMQFYTDGINNDDNPSPTNDLRQFEDVIELESAFNSELENHTIVYGNIDFLVRVRDSQVSETGDDTNSGNLAPHEIYYEIIDEDYAPLQANEVLAIDFNIVIPSEPSEVTANHPANTFFYRPSTCCTNLQYILTTDMHENNNLPVDQYWNTRLAENEQETFTHNDNLNVKTNSNNEYPDGKYIIDTWAADTENETIRHHIPVVIDNFMPYIEKIAILSGGVELLTQEWTFNPFNQRHEFRETRNPYPPSGGNLEVRITSSEVLQESSLIFELTSGEASFTPNSPDTNEDNGVLCPLRGKGKVQ